MEDVDRAAHKLGQHGGEHVARIVPNRLWDT